MSDLGAKFDDGKDRWDLLPWDAARKVVRVLTYGATKYAPGNWRHVPDARARYLSAALRHIVAYGCGERVDQESGVDHLAHAACCLLFLLELPPATVPAELQVPAELRGSGWIDTGRPSFIRHRSRPETCIVCLQPISRHFGGLEYRCYPKYEERWP